MEERKGDRRRDEERLPDVRDLVRMVFVCRKIAGTRSRRFLPAEKCQEPGPNDFSVQKNDRDQVPKVFADRKMIGTGSL